MRILGKFLDLRVGNGGTVPTDLIFGRIITGIVMIVIGGTLLMIDALYHMGGWLYRAFDVVLIILGVLLIKELLDFVRSNHAEKIGRPRATHTSQPRRKTAEDTPPESGEFKEM